jgi:hypothetical protein
MWPLIRSDSSARPTVALIGVLLSHKVPLMVPVWRHCTADVGLAVAGRRICDFLHGLFSQSCSELVRGTLVGSAAVLWPPNQGIEKSLVATQERPSTQAQTGEKEDNQKPRHRKVQSEGAR